MGTQHFGDNSITEEDVRMNQEESSSSLAQEDLNDLLDTALADFDRVKKPSKKKPKAKKTSNRKEEPLPTEDDLLAMFTAAGLSSTHPLHEQLERLDQVSPEDSDKLIKEKLNQTLSQMQLQSQSTYGLQPTDEELQAHNLSTKFCKSFHSIWRGPLGLFPVESTYIHIQESNFY